MEQKAATRREFLRASAMAAAAVAVASCTPATPTPAPTKAPASGPTAAQPTAEPVAAPTAAPAEEIELTFWVCWGAAVPVKSMEDMQQLDEFKAMLPNTKLTVVPGKWTEAVLPAIAAGEGFDVTACQAYNELIARGAMMPLTEQVNASTSIPKDDMYPESWVAVTYKGDIYGVPSIEGYFRLALIYNKEMFEAEALDPEQPPRTWEEVFEAHRKLTKFDSAGNVLQIGLDPYDGQGGWVDSNSPWVPAVSWGVEWFDADELEFMIDQPEVVEAWQMMTEFYKVIGPEKMSAFRQSYPGAANPSGSLCKGTQALQINGYWMPARLVQNAPDKKYGFAWMPVPAKRGQKKIHGVGSHAVMVPTISKHKEEAFKFAEFCISDKFCQLQFEAAGWLPPRKKFVESIDTSEFPGLDWFVKTSQEADEYAACAFNPIESQMLDIWTKLREKAYFGELTDEAAVKQMQAECTKALKEMLAG